MQSHCSHTSCADKAGNAARGLLVLRVCALLWHTHPQGSALRPMELCPKACGAIMVVIQ